ncbi:MAG: hypothetical protein FWH02_00250 [Oscillospiraceae bacterium]|nr:hypothetical protein [Oscillospiraceae bacterium]
MFDKRFWCTLAGIALAAVSGVMLAGIPGGDETPPQPEPVAGIVADIPARESPAEIPDPGYAYILAEYDGHIAVFTPDGDEPQIILDVMVRFLPDYDRAMLARGIPVPDYDALSAMIEDFIS